MQKKILRAGIITAILCIFYFYADSVGVYKTEGIVKTFLRIHIDRKEELKSVTDRSSTGEGAKRAAQVPQIVDIIIDDRKSTALCIDGSVWTWKNKQGRAYAKPVPNLHDVQQIKCAGSVLYALSESGLVFVWGSNRLYQISYQEDRNNNYETPKLISGLQNIKDFGVNTYPKENRGRVFAVDESGNLFTYGMNFYGSGEENHIPAPIPNGAERVGDLYKMCIGSGNSSFFLREDGTVFSIIDSEWWEGKMMMDCIFPSLDESSGYPLEDGRWVDLKVDAWGGFTILYEVGEGEGIIDMTADPYTMFLYKDDNSLWYWDNKFIKYHNCSMDERPKDSVEDYSGSFKQVDLKEIFETDEVPGIADMCSGKENTLFLTEDGRVFISNYVTVEAAYTNNIECVKCQRTKEGNWGWEDSLSWTYPVLAIKDVAFQKLDWENIISINTNGEFDFSAVDSEGNYYHLCTEEESIKEISTKSANDIVKQETYEQEEKGHSVIPYYVPLDEIAEIIEYVYIYDNMWEDIADREFGELGYLPRGEKIPITVYLAEGNKILFLPKGIENKEVWLEHEPYELYYSEQGECFCFLYVSYGRAGIIEAGVPVSSMNERYITTYTIGEGIKGNGIDLSTLVKMGEMEVTFDPGRKIEMPPVSVVQNEYIDAVVEEAQFLLAKRGIYGDFRLYIGKYERVQTEYVDVTECNITGCIVGNDMEQYFRFSVDDSGGIKIADPKSEDADIYFLDGAEYDDDIQKVLEAKRASISFSVVEGQEYSDHSLDEEYGTEYNFDEDIEFGLLGVEEAAEYINYMCSYNEWFGLNELGSQAGEVRGLNHREVIMYEFYSGLLFVPKEKVNTIIQDEQGTDYRFYMNGALKFYCIGESDIARQTGQLGAAMIDEIYFGPSLRSQEYRLKMAVEELTEIGEAVVEITDLPILGMPELEEGGDEYIQAAKNYVKDLLLQNGKHGSYKMYVGEYTIGSSSNKVCISAAVSGGEGEEYYVRYLVVKSQSGKYYFWPTGFGLNGSLEECSADRHYMNRLCIERTKQLGRSEYEINV